MSNIEQFNQQRPLLFSIAYRMLGSVMDAEDIVQEASLRWQTLAEEKIKSAKAYLSTMVTRMCIDHLRSAKVQREIYVGPWLPEPLLHEEMPPQTDSIALSESLSMALLVLLESLTPTERAIFLLREVFDYSYAEIAQIVDKSEANCRQIARRARHHINSRRPRFKPSPKEQKQLTTQFIQTCTGGDLPALINLLADDITLWSDGGGQVVAAQKPIYGAEKVARFLLGITRKAPPDTVPQFCDVNGQLGIIIYVAGYVQSVFTFEFGDGYIQAISVVVNPDKLHHLQPH